MTLSLSSLHIYPVKSAGGISVDHCAVDAFGPRYDRRWMATDQSGRFLSQREDPRLALVGTAIAGDLLVLSAAGHPSLSLPLSGTPAPRRRVEVWADQVSAEDCGADADDWISSVLGRPARLVRMPDDGERQIDQRYASAGEHTAFSDGFPFLLIGEQSLAELNGRLSAPLPMNRFRPNLVVRGSAPHAEDDWARIQIGDVVLRVAKPCARCVVTTTDQETGERGVEPLRTLATYRKVGGKVLFGQNLVHEGVGTLRVGDAVSILDARAGS
jgi:uncharacterized protein